MSNDSSFTSAANHVSNNRLHLNSERICSQITTLGDQGSQVRVLSPRFAAHCTAVQPFSQKYVATTSYGTTAIASMEMSKPRGSLTIGDDRAGGLVGKYSA